MTSRLKPFALILAMMAVLAVMACGSEDPTARPATAQPTATEAMMMEPTATEAMMMEPTATDAMMMEPTATDAMMMEPTATDAMMMEPTATEAMMMQPTATEAMMMDKEKEVIVFSDLNWTSAQVQNRIAQYIVDKGYGYPTDVVFGATLPLLNGLRNSDTQVTMEIWLPNQLEAWTEAVENGEVAPIGESLGKDWQSAFVIPAYLQEQYPELDSFEDLKDDQYKALFATSETGGKARLVSCVIGWACEEVNAQQIESYGLSDHVHIINPGDGAAANADLYGAYEKQEPWLGYQWGTNDPALLLDLVRLDEPAYSDECWATTKACAYEDATILIGINTELNDRASDVVEMFGNWGFNLNRYKEVATWQSNNPDATINDAAFWWLKGNADVWSSWVTGHAAAAITEALDANEIPDGWPTG